MRWVIRVLAALVVIALIVAGGGWYVLSLSLPQTDGTVRLVGPDSAIEIVRDRSGIPHIFAQSRHDAWFAVGFVHAQDRLWQMEMNRRIGAGRLAEVVGEPALGVDRFLRTLSVYHYAERTYANLDAETRAALDSYAAGVNAFLDQRHGPLPPEFLVFGHEPEPWRPADSIVWAKMMAWDLAGNWTEEILRARMARTLSAEQITALFPGSAERGSVLERYAHLYGTLQLDELAEAGRPVERDRENGSNNWVLSGARTASGKPLLANDPHLGLAAPALWYFAHMEAPGLRVIGATLPGTPFVVLGRNDRIAWGFTNTGTDVQDLYIEKLDGDDGYLAPEGPRPFEKRLEIIKVKGGNDVTLHVRTTRHGPVISDVHPGAADAAGSGYVMAFAWPTLRDDDMTPRAAMHMNMAQDWDQFVAALRDFHSPHQNIVYGDVDGNIGFLAPARVPIRKQGHSGNEPVPGWTGEFDWQGFVPFVELPRLLNPTSGMIVTANNRIVPEDYPYYLTYDWAVPYRAQRIAALLDARPQHSIESFKGVQSDVLSGAAQEFLPILLQAAPLSARASAVRDLLMAWDYRMDGSRPEPLIYVAWYRELTRRVYADELGDFFDDYWGLRPRFMHDVLLGDQRKWCNDTGTEADETCPDQIARALEDALDYLTDLYGSDFTRWRWGTAHAARSEHRPFHGQPVIGDLFDIEVPSQGDSFTVNAAHHRITDLEHPFRQHHGPSLRAIYDLEDPDRSLFVHSTGQSGNRLSSLYSSFAERWREVGYLPMSMRRDDIEVGAIGRLVLIPAN
jgi:penicillin amidase